MSSEPPSDNAKLTYIKLSSALINSFVIIIYYMLKMYGFINI